MAQTGLARSRNKKDHISAILDYKLEVRHATLTPKHEAIMQRIDAAWAMLCNHHSRQQVATLLAKQHDISQSQALRDVGDAIAIYGDMQRSSKEAMRYLTAEMAQKTFQLAAKNGDMAAMNKAIANIIKIHGLDRDDPELPDFSKLQNLIVQVIDDRSEGILEAYAKHEGVIDLTKIDKYTEYEEVIEDGTNQGGDSETE